MELNYIETPTNEGGAAVTGCGTIHRSEIRETLNALSNDLELPFDLNDYVLGSTGKREYSGDIDLVIDNKLFGYSQSVFREDLEVLYGKENIARNGTMLHLRYPIKNYDSTLDKRLPRTGYVQIDFNFGDADWERFYHFSPGDSSKYKGAHRNLIIAAITTVVDILSSREVDGYNRPIEIIRWKWSPLGFIRVHRRSETDPRSGVWKKSQKDTNIKSTVDPEEIAKILLPVDGTVKDLESLESIMSAVKRNFGMVDQERIWKKSAENFYNWPAGKNFHYPVEIAQYLASYDK